MSLAIIVQREANTIKGGSIDGQQSGTSAAAASTFYGRRLTNLLVNEQFSAGVNTVVSFTASTGGGASVSTAGQFVLAPGSYRITISAVLAMFAVTDNAIMGLYNVTDSGFEVYAGTSEPVLLTVAYGNVWNGVVCVENAPITVITANKTYELRQAASTTASGRSLVFCGNPTSMTATNVNGAAAKNEFATITVMKTA